MPETIEEHVKYSEAYEVTAPLKSTEDSSSLYRQYILTAFNSEETWKTGDPRIEKEPIAVCEYVHRMVANPSVHAIQIDEVIDQMPDNWD